MIIIYDNKGIIFACGDYPIPDGLPYIEAEWQDRKFAKSVDVTTTPHTVIWEDYPKSELELLRERVAELEATQAIMLTGESEVTE